MGEKFEKAFRLRRNTAVSCFNSLVVGWEKGLSIEGTSVVNNVNGDTLVFSNNVLTVFTNNTNTVYNAGTSGGAASTSSFYTSFWGADGNDSTQSITQVSWVNLFAPLGTTPDARLTSGSSAASGASFTHPKFFVDITGGIEESIELNNISIYPNPANESLVIAFENKTGSAFKLLVSDRVGRIIQTIDVQDEDQNFVTMNVSSLANGMYSILFVGQNSSFTKSFIVAK